VDSDLSRAVWHKSTFSNGNGGNCVETCTLPDGGRAVRHSKHPDGPKLIFAPAEWQAFIAGVKVGEFG
jgi:hypothetical protein